ncbi:hypothetical protein E1200_00965 [Actinomadura sp. GC306]|uniref:hypothetical protein n=1 Tax=Actinomadura sp. GC306 TaxID=2530367 RepID=UPI001045CFAA|nr:hypothetical protein [Actinomadura sp. GC306]TDC71811.1 hypothetical protein E1200_00965 [Actinomadura sp. GC306]
MTPGIAAATSRRLLEVTAALLRSGAAAVKNESSGVAHGRNRWLALSEQAAEAPTPAPRRSRTVPASA